MRLNISAKKVTLKKHVITKHQPDDQVESQDLDLLVTNANNEEKNPTGPTKILQNCMTN